MTIASGERCGAIARAASFGVERLHAKKNELRVAYIRRICRSIHRDMLFERNGVQQQPILANRFHVIWTPNQGDARARTRQHSAKV